MMLVSMWQAFVLLFMITTNCSAYNIFNPVLNFSMPFIEPLLGIITKNVSSAGAAAVINRDDNEDKNSTKLSVAPGETPSDWSEKIRLAAATGSLDNLKLLIEQSRNNIDHINAEDENGWQVIELSKCEIIDVDVLYVLCVM